MDPQLHRLDELAKAIIQRKPGALRAASVLSTGEQLYVYLAANREDKLRARGDTVAQALARIGPYWVEQLIERWQYDGFPDAHYYGVEFGD